VTDSIPQRAQAVANELANQLILLGPEGARLNAQDRQDFVNRQLDTLQSQVETTEAEIQRLQEELGNLQSARQISDTQSQISALQNKLTTLQSNYADLLATTQSGSVNTLSLIEPAPLPVRPVGPNKMVSILLAAAVGFVLAAAAAYLLDYLDDTLKTPEQVERATGSTIIGYLQETKDEFGSKIFVTENPRHPLVEGYRSLRTNLEFASVDNPLKILLVTSAETESGKSFVASNLAAIIAQAEKKVILVDADMRRPNVHNFFELSNDYGLSDIFRGKLSVDDAIKEWQDGQVSVITAGNTPPNSSELLGSKKMSQILVELAERADFVVVDGPPFVVADASILASKVDGVLVVIRSGYTHEPSVKSMMAQIQRSGARVVGVALNRVAKGAGYYGYESYYGERSETEGVKEDVESKGGRRKSMLSGKLSTGTNPGSKQGIAESPARETK
jgi:capsular exopolysaccharide synthesis family protein